MWCPYCEHGIKAMHVNRADATRRPGSSGPSRGAQGCQGKDCHGSPRLPYPEFLGQVKSLELLSSLLSKEKPRSFSLCGAPGEGGAVPPSFFLRHPHPHSCFQAPLPDLSLLSALGCRQCPATCLAWNVLPCEPPSCRIFLPPPEWLPGWGQILPPLLSRMPLTANGIHRYHLI